jgi:hypothetical protein
MRLPCLPDPTTGQLKCGSACVQLGDGCTTNADCCTGLLCQATPGSVGGSCVITTTPVGQPDAGVPPVKADAAADAVTPTDDASGPGEADAPPLCGFWGQGCSVTQPCCGYIQCSARGGSPCTADDTECLCYSPS